ncbi:MAG TPA: T9SS type A sorting domain-containing protein, partial [Bacteroidia bacterium]
FHFIPHIWAQDTLVSCADTISAITNFDFSTVGSSNPAYNSYTIHGDTVDIYRSGVYFAIFYYPEQASNCILLQPIVVLVDTALIKPPKSIDLGPDASFCEGYVHPLNAGSGFESYHWNTGAIDSATTVYGFGAYSVTAHYCGFDYSDTITITQNNSLMVDLGPDQNDCTPVSVTLDAGTGYESYLWSTGEQTQQINADTTGEYTVQVSLNGCIGRDTVTIVCNVGIANPSDCSDAFSLTPNPGNDIVSITQKCGRYKNITLSVSGSDGKQLAKTTGSIANINTYLNQLMPALSPAVYIVRIETENERYYFKWMIVR